MNTSYFISLVNFHQFISFFGALLVSISGHTHYLYFFQISLTYFSRFGITKKFFFKYFWPLYPRT